MAITLKELRKQKGWSLDKTALATGVSKAMLGQIEREESSPTIATLWKIATGFGVSFSAFIEEMATTDSNVHHRGQAQIIHPTDEKIRIYPLFPFDATLHFELFVIELLPNCLHLSLPHQQGVVEHIVVIEGNMEVLIDGAWRPLTTGEGLRFDANQAHGYRNLTTDLATFHDMIHYPVKR